MGSILSGIMGGGSSPGQQAQMHGLQQTQQNIQDYRPQAMQARINLLSNASTPYQGMNNALETLWGAPPAPPPQGMDKLRGGYGPTPPRVMGHDMPAPQPIHVSSNPNYVSQGPDPLGQIIDPLNLFKSW